MEFFHVQNRFELWIKLLGSSFIFPSLTQARLVRAMCAVDDFTTAGVNDISQYLEKAYQRILLVDVPTTEGEKW